MHKDNRLWKLPNGRDWLWGNLGLVLMDRNDMDLTEAEDIKKRWQEYTEELYKKHLHDPDNHNECDRSPRARHPAM